MKTITSRQNPEIIEVSKLIHAKERAAQNQFIAEGIRTCQTLLNSSVALVRLYLSEEKVKPILKKMGVKIPNDKICVVSEPVMEKLSHVTTASGIVGVFQIPQYPLPKTVPAGLVLADIADPGNMGTLIRTGVALNVPAIITINGADVWSPKVVQASAGTVGNVPIFSLDWQDLIKRKGTHKLCALVVSGGKKPSPQFQHSLLVVGSEAHGIQSEWVQQCDEQLTIPMPGNAESLNAAIAGSIALYLIYNP